MISITIIGIETYPVQQSRKIILRNTKQKDQILEAVRKHGQHPTADEIYKVLKTKHPRLSLATVYRNLNQFADLGQLGRVKVSGGPLHFDTHTEPHTHAVCQDCSRIVDIFDPELNRQLADRLESIEGMSEFELTRADLKYIGRCADCVAKSKQNKN